MSEMIESAEHDKSIVGAKGIKWYEMILSILDIVTHTVVLYPFLKKD